jgi:UDP-glucose 4-epimerase
LRSSERTALVTGGLGFIGGVVVQELLGRGWHVRILDNGYRSDPAAAALFRSRDGVEVVEGDVRYAGVVENAMRGVDAVVHLAAVCMNKSISDPVESLDVNLLGTQNVLDAAAHNSVPRIVFASSASIYGNPTSLPMYETDTPAPLTPYCIAKLAGEQLLAFHGRRSGISWIALRFFNVYGPGQQTDAYYTSVVNTFLRRIANGEAPVIDGRGEQSMDFVHVADVARAVAMAVESSASGEVLNVGTGAQTTVAELADYLVRAVGADVKPVFRPREVLVTQRAASTERISAVLGWKPSVDLEEGIASVVDHFKLSGELDRYAAGR